METDMIQAVRQINIDLFDKFSKLNNKDIYTNPYLIIPDDSYAKARKKVLILGKETNGWGEAEGIACLDGLEQLYTKKVLNRGFSKDYNPFWDFCLNWILPLFEDNKDFGVCFSNAALIGRPYGMKGFAPELTDILCEYQKKYMNALSPDIIICFIGFGTDKHVEKPYLKILEPVFGEYCQKEDILLDDCTHWPLRRLAFSNKNMVFGTRHPQCASNLWKESICESIRKIIIS